MSCEIGYASVSDVLGDPVGSNTPGRQDLQSHAIVTRRAPNASLIEFHWPLSGRCDRHPPMCCEYASIDHRKPSLVLADTKGNQQMLGVRMRGQSRSPFNSSLSKEKRRTHAAQYTRFVEPDLSDANH